MSSLVGPDDRGVFTITFDSSASKDHRLSKSMFASLHGHLDTIEAHGGKPVFSQNDRYTPTGDLFASLKNQSSKKNALVLSGGDPEQRPGRPTAVVLTGPIGSKFWSNGFDLEYLGTNPKHAFEALHKLCGRLLTFPVPTVACLQGHCFAGGVFVALCCDYRVMNGERGFICLNELQDQELFAGAQGVRHMRFPFTDNMVQIVGSRCSR